MAKPNRGGAVMLSSNVVSARFFFRPQSSRLFLISLLFFASLATILFMCPQNVYSVDIVLAWDANAEKDPDGYKIFRRGEGESYNYDNPVLKVQLNELGENPQEPTCTIHSLDDNITHYFVVRAFDTTGFESADSNEVCYSSNAPPTASDQSISTHEDISAYITLRATDVDADTLTYAIVAYPSHGTLSGTGSKQNYTSNTNYVGSDSFTFKANDGTVDSNIATVTIIVNPVDTDGDGILDYYELNTYNTDPNNPDTDGDGINDGDEVEFWGYNWDMDFDNDSIINLLDTDSDNDGFLDGTEKDQSFDPADPNSKPEFPLEIGEVIVDHNWKWVEFNDSFIDPVVVAKPLSCNEDEPAVVRIGYVDATGFVIRVQEWDYLDGIHAYETVGYMVMERGTYTLPDGTMVKAGTFDTNRTGFFGWVNFSQTFNQVPVVATTVLSFNEKDAVCCRLRNINTAGFDFCMQEQEFNRQIHATESISYIAWEPSSGTIGNLTFEVEKTDDVIKHYWQTIVYNETFMNLPVFLSDMQTTNGGNTANLRWQDKDFYGIDVKIAEEQSLDSEIYHITEVVGYMVFSKIDLGADTDG